MAQDFHDLVVWQKAIELTVCIYKLTRTFPEDEKYGLVSQMRRASVSIASNIAEGRGRLNPAEFRQFLGMSQGSMFELKTQLLVARKLGMANGNAVEEAERLSDEVSKMLRAFIQTLRAKAKSQELIAKRPRKEVCQTLSTSSFAGGSLPIRCKHWNRQAGPGVRR
jgi:four helix bundle protein